MSSSVFKSTDSATLPWEAVSTVTKTVVIDSRQRNANVYTASDYRINIGDVFKNINTVELKGALIPKTNYNVHSSNNKIDFAIGDFVSKISINNRGSGYTSVPNVIISNPKSGVNAQAQAFIDMYSGTVSHIIITVPGSGYIPSQPPIVYIEPPNDVQRGNQASAVVTIGNHYTATLRVGEYEIGGNPNPPTTNIPTNLLLEIQNSMNYAVSGTYDPTSTSPFAAVLVNQYPEINPVAGSPESFDTNACRFNRVQVVNVNSDPWQFLWYSGSNRLISAYNILGFGPNDSYVGKPISSISSGGGIVVPEGTAIRALFDYNLKNDPDYIILTIYLGDDNLDRITSINDGIDHTFCVLLFDNNNPETLHDLSNDPVGGSTFFSNNVAYLSGKLGKGNFWRDPGGVKPIKGNDFDGPKKITFRPPKGKVSNMRIKFTKFGEVPGETPHAYNMDGREHVLMFEFSCNDLKSRMVE